MMFASFKSRKMMRFVRRYLGEGGRGRVGTATELAYGADRRKRAAPPWKERSRRNAPHGFDHTCCIKADCLGTEFLGAAVGISHELCELPTLDVVHHKVPAVARSP